jgi:hypothetical protein
MEASSREGCACEKTPFQYGNLQRIQAQHMASILQFSGPSAVSLSCSFISYSVPHINQKPEQPLPGSSRLLYSTQCPQADQPRTVTRWEEEIVS